MCLNEIYNAWCEGFEQSTATVSSRGLGSTLWANQGLLQPNLAGEGPFIYIYIYIYVYIHIYIHAA